MTLCYNELSIHNDEQEWIDFIYIFFGGETMISDNHQKYNRIRVKIQEHRSSHILYRETLKISISTTNIIYIKGRGS